MNRYAIFIVLSCAMIVMICGSASAASPSANFTANTTNGHSPLNVHFTDKSTGNPTSWNWDFGDGSISTDKNPNHTFSTVGAYTIKLTATNEDGSSSLTRTNYITAWNTTSVMSSNNGIAFYVANDAGVKYDIANGVNQQGDYQQIHVNNSYYISRGGGGMNPIQISTDPTNKHGTITTANNQSGTFWVVFSGGISHMDDCILMLAVNGTIPDNFAFHVTANGYTYDLPAPALSNPVTSTLTNVQYVTGVNETFTKDDFIYGPQSWKPTNTVNYPIYQGQDPNNQFSLMFIDLDVGAFGTNAYPGVTNGSIEVNYSFSNLESFASFGAYGWFSACNWGTGIPMASNIAQGGYNVQGITPVTPVANFTTNTTTGLNPASVQFTDTSSNTPNSWLWDFGDGTTSTDQNPTHVYSTPGTYTVTLIATNNAGSGKLTLTNYITVNYPAPIAGFTANTTKGTAPIKVKFTDSSTGNVSGYIWNFGDGTTSTDQNPTHTYKNPGNYTVKLTVTNHGGSSTVTSLITVQNHVLPTATANVKSGIYNSTKTVIISMNKSGSIYYTINGVTPTTSSKKYTGPINIKSTTKLKFLAVDSDGYKSNVYTENYTIDKIPPKSNANIGSGLYNSDKTVKLTMDKKGTIYYTTNGSTPTISSKKYTGSITLKSTTILKFIAVDIAGNKSPVYTNKYTIDKTAPEVKSSNPVNGAKNASTTSTITIKFNKNVKTSLNWSKIHIKNLSTGKLVSIKTTIKHNQINIRMTHTRYSNNKYQVYVPQSAVKDNAGNNLKKTYYFSFKTK